MVAHESGESDRDKALSIKEERHSKVESSEEEELESPGAAASAAPSGKEEGRKEKEEEEHQPLPATSAADPAASTTPAVEKTAETTSAVEKTAETKEEEENTKGTEGPGEEEEPERDPTVEPGAEAADPAAQPSSGRVIADFITSPEGIKTGWEVRGIHAKYTPAKVDPKAPWRKQVKKQIWGQVKKHPEPQSGFRLRSKVSLQYRKLKDLVRLQKKQGVITEDLTRRIKDFGKERPPHEIKEEREEQKVRNQEKRIKKRKTSEKSEAADSAEEEVEEEESLSLPSPVPQPRTPDGPPPAKRPQARNTERGRAVWGRALELNLRIVTLANERAQRKPIENWKLESPFQVRKIAADELVEQRGLKGTVALAAIRELWKTPNDQGKRGSNEACSNCSSCDERRQAQLPVVQDYIKRRGLKGPARLGSSAKAKAAPKVNLTPRPKEKAKAKATPKEKAKAKATPKEKAKAKATPTVGRNPEELTRTTIEVRGVPKASKPSQG